MTRRRGVIPTLLLSLSFLIVAPTSNSAITTGSDEEWEAVAPKDELGIWAPGYIGIDSKPSEQLLLFPSFLLNFIGEPGKPTKVSACTSPSDANCVGGYAMRARAELQPCSTTNPTDCFLDLLVRDATGKDLSSTLVTDQMQPMQQTFTGDQKLWLPTGGNPLLFRIPDAKHSGGALYLVKPDVIMQKTPDQETFGLVKFEAGIYPVNIRPLTSETPIQAGANTDVKNYGGQIEFSGNADPSCSNGLSDGKNCYIPQAFPTGITFGMKLRLSHSLYGWLHGRFADPEISLDPNPASQDGVDLTIIGKPIKVPVISGFIKSATAPAKILKYFEETPRWGAASGPGISVDRNGPLEKVTILHNHFDPSSQTFTELNDWLDLLGDISAAEPSYWLVQTIVGGNSDQVAKCTKDSKNLAGVVSTNATAYLPGPPVFDETEQTLDYKVLAPHYTKKKEIFLGTYNLVINGDIARCIYGFTQAPISASVAVVSSEGSSRVATTVVSQDERFVKLSALGFEFSTPIVKVKMTQAVTATPVTSPSPEVATPKSPSKKRVITCVRGNLKKQVKGTNPKCPGGYKNIASKSLGS